MGGSSQPQALPCNLPACPARGPALALALLLFVLPYPSLSLQSSATRYKTSRARRARCNTRAAGGRRAA